jgi:hypothetical protein
VKKIFVFFVITAAVVGLSLIPYDTVFVPEWHLRIVDGSGNPVVGVRVVQFCTNYTLGIHPCELVDDDEMTTDNDGFVVFPARKIRANLLYRVTRPIFGLVLLVANDEYGTNGYIRVGGPCGNKLIDYKPEGPLPSTIAVCEKGEEEPGKN